MDLDADPELKLSYEDLRLRGVNDPVGQCLIIELLLRLFVMHILGAQPDAVAQPTGVKVAHENWFSDGVAASARGELEASGRGSLHGHWELWALAAGRFRNWHDWQWPSHTRSDWRHGGMDY